MAGNKLLLDTSPLITLCSFRAAGSLIIEHVLKAAAPVFLVESVAVEATVNPAYADAAVVRQLIDAKRIVVLTPPVTLQDEVIDSYTKLGQGERDSIRLSFELPETPLVLDDYLAFVIAVRFGLKPILLLDLIVSLVEDKRLEKALAREIVEQIAPRYSLPFVTHTRTKLK